MAIEQLLEIMRTLREPKTGCEWDRTQTLESIVPHTLEEAYEVADAIRRGDPRAIRDELGDLLFQVVFLAQIASEQDWFDFDEVAASIADKLIRRHPHVFTERGAESTLAISAEQQSKIWETLKAEERLQAGERGVLDGVAITLPALIRAGKLGKRAARVGFDWPDPGGVRAKVDEEFAEFEATLREAQSRERQTDELGDLLFAIANWARHLGLDAEAALRGSNEKFSRRFASMERLAAERDLRLEKLDLAAWESLWAEAKRLERQLESS
jgi:MazG family protein